MPYISKLELFKYQTQSWCLKGFWKGFCFFFLLSLDSETKPAPLSARSLYDSCAAGVVGLLVFKALPTHSFDLAWIMMELHVPGPALSLGLPIYCAQGWYIGCLSLTYKEGPGSDFRVMKESDEVNPVLHKCGWD